jgi:hypothetical protein
LGRIKVRGGSLVHHGYQRPGWGHIVGDCFGVHRLPHETSPDAAKAYLSELVLPVLEDRIKTKARVETATVLMYTYPRRAANHQKVPVSVEVKQGESSRHHQDAVDKVHHRIPSFDQVRQYALHDLANEIGKLEGEKVRITNLIDTWTKQDLTTVEEEASQGRAVADAKRAEKQAIRDQKLAEKAQRDAARAASAQAKIDKSVAKCLPILEAMDATDIQGVRNAYLKVLQLKLPITENQRWGFFESHLPENHKATLKAAGLVDHNGNLMNWDTEVYRLPVVTKG